MQTRRTAPIFWSSLGLLVWDRLRPVHSELRMLISMPVDSLRSDTRQAQASRFPFFRSFGLCSKGCAKAKRTVIVCSRFATPRKPLLERVAAWDYRHLANARF